MQICGSLAMVASIGVIASPSQGASYYERDGYYAKDDPAHEEASRWTGKGAEALGLAGPVDPDAFRKILEGKVPDGPQLGKRGQDGEIQHRPGRDVTLSAPKSVSLLAMVGGDGRIVEAHDQAVGKTLAWIEEHAVQTRMQDKATGTMIRVGGQTMVAATFRHGTSRNLDPQLHTHCVIANMVQSADGKWRTMVNDGLYRNKMAIGAIYRAELAVGLKDLGYGIEKTHPDGRFEIAGVSRDAIEAFSTRHAEIEAAMAERGLGVPADNPHLAARATLMTRASKRDVDKSEPRQAWRGSFRAAIDTSLQITRQHVHNLGNQRLQFRQPIARGKHDDNRNRQLVRALLILDASIDGDKGIEAMADGQRQQQAVPGACPTHLLNRARGVRCGKGRGKTPRHRFVKQQLHRWTPALSSRAPAVRRPDAATPLGSRPRNRQAGRRPRGVPAGSAPEPWFQQTPASHRGCPGSGQSAYRSSCSPRLNAYLNFHRRKAAASWMVTRRQDRGGNEDAHRERFGHHERSASDAESGSYA